MYQVSDQLVEGSVALFDYERKKNEATCFFVDELASEPNLRLEIGSAPGFDANPFSTLRQIENVSQIQLGRFEYVSLSEKTQNVSRSPGMLF